LLKVFLYFKAGRILKQSKTFSRPLPKLITAHPFSTAANPMTINNCLRRERKVNAQYSIFNAQWFTQK